MGIEAFIGERGPGEPSDPNLWRKTNSIAAARREYQDNLSGMLFPELPLAEQFLARADDQIEIYIDIIKGYNGDYDTWQDFHKLRARVQYYIEEKDTGSLSQFAKDLYASIRSYRVLKERTDNGLNACALLEPIARGAENRFKSISKRALRDEEPDVVFEDPPEQPDHTLVQRQEISPGSLAPVPTRIDEKPLPPNKAVPPPTSPSYQQLLIWPDAAPPPGNWEGL